MKTEFQRRDYMPNIVAASIDGILGSDASPDGQQGHVHVDNAGQRTVLAMKPDVLVGMIQAASDALGKCRKLAATDPKLKSLLPVEWWEFGEADGNVILSFRLPGGAEMSYGVDITAAKHMRDVLNGLLGEGQSLPQGTIKQ